MAGTVINLTLHVKAELAARLGHAKLEAACCSALNPKGQATPIREPHEPARSVHPGATCAGQDGRPWRCEEVPASHTSRSYRLWHLENSS